MILSLFGYRGSIWKLVAAKCRVSTISHMPPKRPSRLVKRSRSHPDSSGEGNEDPNVELAAAEPTHVAPKKTPSRKKKTPAKLTEDHATDVDSETFDANNEKDDEGTKPAKKVAAAAQKKGRKPTAKMPTPQPAKQVAPSEDHGESTPVQPPSGPGYYLMKSEPHDFSIDDQAAKPDGTYCWEGVRNAQAKNIMRGMKVGEQIFFYHSSCKVPGIVGLCTVAKEAYPDYTAWDPKSKYYDERSTEDKPKWFMVDVKFVRKTKRMITLEELKRFKDAELSGMVLLNRSRLSVQPVTKDQWEFIMSLEDQDPEEDG